MQKDDGGEHHVELAVLDSVGRLQIPREYLEQFDINRRVLIETVDDGILIRKPDGEAPSGEQVVSSEEQVEVKNDALQSSSKVSQILKRVMTAVKKGAKK